MDVLGNRIRRVVESVLENEGLVEGLDQAAAEALQQWTIGVVTQIVEGTADLDDQAAEQAMYPRLRAARRLTRAIRVWMLHQAESTPEERLLLWNKVAARVRSLYGLRVMLPDPAAFQGAAPSDFIENLRAWLDAQ